LSGLRVRDLRRFPEIIKIKTPISKSVKRRFSLSLKKVNAAISMKKLDIRKPIPEILFPPCVGGVLPV
jgi:hypothetical protein